MRLSFVSTFSISSNINYVIIKTNEMAVIMKKVMHFNHVDLTTYVHTLCLLEHTVLQNKLFKIVLLYLSV